MSSCAAEAAYERLAALPVPLAALFAPIDADLFASRAWYEASIADALPPDAAPLFVPAGQAALFPMRRDEGGRRLQSLTTPYSCLYRPLLREGLDDAALREAGRAFGAFCRDWPVVRLDALPADWPPLGPLCAGIRAAGMVVRRFDHFGNWHEMLRGRDWAQYLAARPGRLRETIRRKLRRSEATFSLIRGGAGLEGGIAAFEAVYQRSWKEPEPFPRFNAGLMRRTAAQGLLRLGLLHVGAEAVAAQLWVVEGGRASVLKLAHDEAFKPLSPGTVLTASMIRTLIEEDAPGELDFGRGDDPYKQDWTSERRQRIGLLLLNPRRPRGLAELARHWAGSVRRRL